MSRHLSQEQRRGHDRIDVFLVGDDEVGGAELKPTGHVIKCMDLDPIREKLTRAGLTLLPRQDGDDAEIIESWI